MDNETHLVNDLVVSEETSGGWTFVYLRDTDDGDKFQLGEDEILALHKYLSGVIERKRL
jgi:hypothetical protein